MKRSSLFWGIVVILLGVIFLLSNLHLVTLNMWSIFWPFLIVLLGLWLLLGPGKRRKSMEKVQSILPLENSTSAEIEFHHGAGRLEVNNSARPGELINGWFTGGVNSEIHHDDGLTTLKLRTPSDFPFQGTWPTGSHGLEWIVGMTAEIPLKLSFHTGASESLLDLSGLKVTDLSLETGASATEITMPASAGATHAAVKSGVASVKIKIPEGVAAHLHVQSGLSGINVDTQRFIQNGADYISADYGTAVNKLDLYIETGVGSVEIR